MKARGWVFVVTNPLAPELCRVSFSAKDPEWRAREMNRNGAEHPFVVEYAVAIDNPHWYKLMACRKLTEEGKQEIKDWFRCPSEDAAAAVREAVGKNRIFSELIRGIENVKRAEPLPDGETVLPVNPKETGGGTREKVKDDTSPSGQAVDSLELAAAIRQALENAEKSTPANTLTGREDHQESVISIEDVLSAITPQDAGKEEMEKIMEEKHRREKREEVRHDVDEVRRVMEERKKMEQEPQEPQVKELDIIVVPSSVKEDKKRSILWEVLLLLISDIGCIYIIIASKGVTITAVAVILASLFSLLLMDAIKQHIKNSEEKEKSKLP